MNIPTIEEFSKAIKNKIASLKNSYASCWICTASTNNWGVILPDGDEAALGFGSRGDGTSRLVFFPVCECHDMEDEANVFTVRMLLSVKRMEMLN